MMIWEFPELSIPRIRLQEFDLARGRLATEKKLSARKNHPLVIFGSQLARSAFESCPPIFSSALE
jgi:hypothetical protein